MSESSVRATLVQAIQDWFDANCDDIGETFGIWQDPEGYRNAELYADAVMACVRAAELQQRIEDVENPT